MRLDSERIIISMQRMNSGELCGFGNERGKADLTVGRAFVQRSSVWGIYKLLNLHSEQRAPQGAAARGNP